MQCCEEWRGSVHWWKWCDVTSKREKIIKIIYLSGDLAFVWFHSKLSFLRLGAFLSILMHLRFESQQLKQNQQSWDVLGWFLVAFFRVHGWGSVSLGHVFWCGLFPVLRLVCVRLPMWLIRYKQPLAIWKSVLNCYWTCIVAHLGQDDTCGIPVTIKQLHDSRFSIVYTRQINV